ncbi:vascular endothelial growth factor A-like isoform X1 [Neodiprion pinetum]|uniref:vascular endothelial growth factor A-like isoform X1 n=2 Tax=Neodiprion pinetum TaxID=441929 RepID=UPI003716C24C
MNFASFVLCIFVALLAIAQSERILSNRSADYDVHNEINCRQGSRGLKHTIMNSICRPYERHVDLKPLPGFRFIPPTVSIKRCDGHCLAGLSCVPVSKRLVDVHVQVKRLNQVYGQPIMMCGVVKVEEHDQCRCKCQRTAKDCNDRQDYNVDSCSCDCKNGNQKKEDCERQMGKTWNDDECSCNCNELEVLCTNGQYWDEKQCKCVQ